MSKALLPPRTVFLPRAVQSLLGVALPALVVSALGSAAAGLAQLAALWCVIGLLRGAGTGAVIGACAFWICGAALSSGSSRLAHDAEGGFEARLRRRVAAHMLRLPSSSATARSGDALRRLVADDVRALHHMIAHLPAELAVFIVVPLASAISLVVLAGPLALLALIPGALAAVVYLAVIPRLSARHGAERARVMGEITAAVDDFARGIRVCRIYGAEAGALAEYRDATRRFTSGMVGWVRRVATPAAVAVALLQAATSFAIAYAVGFRWESGALAATLFFGLALVGPALRLGHGLDYVAEGRAAARRIADLLDEPVADVRGEKLSGAGPVDVEIDGLTAAVGGRALIAGLSHTMRPATLTAVTGPSGAGKTTLARMLSGMEPVPPGRIRIGGIDAHEVGADSWAAGVTFLPQGGDVLAGTVRDNLALVAPEAPDEDCLRVLRRMRLPLSLDDEASTLSGGERQRLGLARVLLHAAPVVILDEPTSALDRTTADLCWSAFLALAHDEGRTVLAITHDPALAATADSVIRLGGIASEAADVPAPGGTSGQGVAR